MAKILNKVRCEGKGMVMVAGSFVGGSAAATKRSGTGFTIAHSGTTGLYNLTFDEAYYELVSFVATVQAATPADVKGHTVVADTLSSKVLPLWLTNASDADHDLAASEWINFVAIFRNTSVTT